MVICNQLFQDLDNPNLLNDMTTTKKSTLAVSQASMGKTKLTFIIIAPEGLAKEGKKLFLSHAKWMKSTHYHVGTKALLSYDVSEMKELKDPTNLKSKFTGKTVFVLSELYKSKAGPADHLLRTPDWKDWPKFDQWLKKCQVTKVCASKVFNSLTWGGK